MNKVSSRASAAAFGDGSKSLGLLVLGGHASTGLEFSSQHSAASSAFTFGNPGALPLSRASRVTSYELRATRYALRVTLNPVRLSSTMEHGEPVRAPQHPFR